MKSTRQLAILEVIREKNIETQEELAEVLKQRGFQVTQATVSRDIKELRLVKVLNAEGEYRYATPEKSETALNDRLIRMFRETILSIKSAYNQIILKTLPASANIACEAIDNLNWPEILGTIAGENTILIILARIEDAPVIEQRLNDMLQGTKS